MTTKSQLLRVIKLQCQECFGSEDARKGILQTGAIVDEVRQCSAPECSLFPYRLGRDPKPSRKGNRDNLKKALAAASVAREKAQISTIGP